MRTDQAATAGLAASAEPDACPACPVCGAAATSARRAPKGYVRCGACRHIFVPVSPGPAELARLYEDLRQGEERAGAAAGAPRARLLDRMVSGVEAKLLGGASRRYFELHRFVPPAGGGARRLLDLGCGEGVTLEAFAQPGWSLFGVDVSPTAVAAARRRVPQATLIAGDWSEARRLGRFDLVRLDNVLEHMPDPVAVLRTARSLVEDGGWLAVYVPHGDSLSLRWLGSRSLNHWPPFHLHLFTEGSLRRALGEAGFGQVEVARLDPPTWWDLTLRHVLDRRWRERPLSPRAAPLVSAAALPLRLVSQALAAGEELAAFARAT